MKVKVDVNQEHVGRIHGDNKSDTVDSENADEYKIMKRPVSYTHLTLPTKLEV